jgi:ubiquinone/menaquinone biosynthesis C-methylase UbiE
MELENTYRIESAKWDALAQKELSVSSVLQPTATFQKYVETSNVMVGVNEFLGDLQDKHVLEYGCGLGAISTLMAKSGAHVTAFDLSPVSVATARQRAVMNNVDHKIDLVVAAGENLPYADACFDVIFGKAILHHLSAKLGWIDLYRVLKPAGKAVFVEPMGMNPILNFIRAYVPYLHKHPRGADHPLKYDDIYRWGKPFKEFRYQEIQLLSMFERAFGFNKRLSTLRRVDNVLLKCLPFLRSYCRYVVMFMVK